MITTSLVFSEEDADLGGRAWRLNAGGYARTTINKKPQRPEVVFAHHLVCERAFGRRPDWSKRETCDHIDGDKLNNRRENLRIVNCRINQLNSEARRNGKLAYATMLSIGRYQSQVQVGGVPVYLGTYKTALEANAAARGVLKFIGEEAQP